MFWLIKLFLWALSNRHPKSKVAFETFLIYVRLLLKIMFAGCFANCIIQFWNIYFQVIHLKFTALDTECRYDYVEIHDGRTNLYPSFGQFCNLYSLQNRSLTSTRHTIFIKFHSDHNIARTGFRLNWNAQEPGKIFSIKSNFVGFSLNSTQHIIIKRVACHLGSSVTRC